MDISIKEVFMRPHISEKGRRYHFDQIYDPVLKLSKVDLYQVGELIAENGYIINEHKQICNEISYVLDGECDFYTDGKVFHAQKGDIHIVSKDKKHKIIVTGNRVLRMVYIGFEFREEESIGSNLCKFYSKVPEQLQKDIKICTRKFENLLDEVYAAQEFNEDMINAYIMEIIIHVYRIYQQGGEEKVHRIIEDARLEKTVGNTVLKVIRYVDRNIEECISVEKMASDLKYSRTYLSRVFSEKMKMPIRQYIDLRKIAVAKRLMEDGVSVSDTAYRLGYTYPQSLYKLFLRYENCKPSDYINKKEKMMNRVKTRKKDSDTCFEKGKGVLLHG